MAWTQSSPARRELVAAACHRQRASHRQPGALRQIYQSFTSPHVPAPSWCPHRWACNTPMPAKQLLFPTSASTFFIAPFLTLSLWGRAARLPTAPSQPCPSCTASHCPVPPLPASPVDCEVHPSTGRLSPVNRLPCACFHRVSSPAFARMWHALVCCPAMPAAPCCVEISKLLCESPFAVPLLFCSPLAAETGERASERTHAAFYSSVVVNSQATSTYCEPGAACYFQALHGVHTTYGGTLLTWLPGWHFRCCAAAPVKRASLQLRQLAA